ncbi:unnamed protein product [Urochloa humidicola]
MGRRPGQQQWPRRRGTEVAPAAAAPSSLGSAARPSSRPAPSSPRSQALLAARRRNRGGMRASSSSPERPFPFLLRLPCRRGTACGGVDSAHPSAARPGGPLFFLERILSFPEELVRPSHDGGAPEAGAGAAEIDLARI